MNGFQKFIAFVGEYWKQILITVAIIIVLWYVLKWTGLADEIKGKLKKPPKATTPDGFDGSQAQWFNPDTGMMEAYDPRPDVVELKEAMAGPGTDEDAIWSVLDLKTDQQLVAIYNDFQDYTGEDLFEWFSGDLSGENLSRAMNYFSGIQIN